MGKQNALTALRLNKKICLSLFCCLGTMLAFGQYEEAAVDSVVYESPGTIQYDPNYHFDDSDQVDYERSKPEPQFDREHWKNLVRDMKYEEGQPKEKDTGSKINQVKDHNTGSAMFSSSLKYAWIIIAILILAVVVFKFVPAFGQRNIRNRQDLVIGLDDLDEEDIKSIDIDSPLKAALAAGDYRKAYRLRYLSVLKELIGRNMILYKKEKTNYEYLLQLSGHGVYEPFRLLTFNFDGIWYGELSIDKTRYEDLDQHFVNFNREIGT